MERRQLETTVGIFILVGLLIIAAMIIQFGKIGQSFRKTYPLTVQFSDGSGILKGAQVRYSGTMVGRVAGPPVLTTAKDGDQIVVVTLNIHEEIRIRDGSKFTVGQSGFLGDSYIDISPPKGQARAFLAPGTVIDGSKPADLGMLTAEGADLMTRLNSTAKEMELISKKINQTLTPEKMREIDETIAHVRNISANVDKLTADISSGRGAIGKLLYDPRTASDVEALIYNLRKHGPLFYSDSFADDQSRPGPVRNRQPASSRTR